MATSWKIQNKRFDSGPDWESLDASGWDIYDEWENMTTVYWDYVTWTFLDKASSTDNWTVITGTKGKIATET
tara:strand:- start:188 stop:403 length:216 start_codon:yes stop_codon:yes gene_type:complete